MAFGEDIEYCESCGSIIELGSCQVCGTPTPEEEYNNDFESDEED
ncbi:MAG: hypothetical protein WA916_01120 [Arcobacter sp.]